MIVTFKYRSRDGSIQNSASQSLQYDAIHVGNNAIDATVDRNYYTGQIVGPVTIQLESGSQARIDAQLIKTLTIGANNVITIVISIPSPIPDYPTHDPADGTLDITLTSPSNAPNWTVYGTNIPWFDEHQHDTQANLNLWMAKGSTTLFRLKDQKPFPLDELGICKRVTSGADNPPRGAIGLFSSPREDATSELCFVFAPFEYPRSNGPFKALSLLPFGAVSMSPDSTSPIPWISAPGVLICYLGPSGNPDRIVPNWFTALQWRPQSYSAPSIESQKFQLAVNDVFQKVWNEVNVASIFGARTTNGGRSWVPLPLLTCDSQLDARPILLFSTPGANRKAELRRVYLYGPNAICDALKLQIEFPWQFNNTLPGQEQSAACPSLKLEGKFDSAIGGDWLEKNGLNNYLCPLAPGVASGLARYTVDSILNTEESDVLAEWLFHDISVVSASEGYTLGSVQFTPDINSREGTLTIRLRGEWSDSRCDLYPEIMLDNLPCDIRFSGSGDPTVESLRAHFDAAGGLEEQLQSETSGMILPDPDKRNDALNGSLSLRMLCEPGRDSITELRLQTAARNVDTRSVYFQARPFTVASIVAPEFDEQAGDDFAYWRSDDPEGPQWRLPAASVTFDFPPQTVAEEMERGNRFWDGKTKTYIDTSRPVQYRFSPPTRLRVRPPINQQRYNPSPNNLGEILQSAAVDSFTTEVLYPIRTSFTRDNNGDPDIRIAEAGSFFGKPAPNLPVLKVTASVDDQAQLAKSVLEYDLADWLFPSPHSTSPSATEIQFCTDYRSLRWRHSAARANFVARLGEFHLYDPWRKDNGLCLTDGLKFDIRDTKMGARPLRSPLPNDVDIFPSEKQAIGSFLNATAWSNNSIDSLRAGALHTIEFPSELLAILRTPTSSKGEIESLSFSALGATGKMAASFDEERTTFTVEAQHGQISRLIKTRIGRIAVLWNKAKHVVVYERTTVPSEQFEAEQPPVDLAGWPVLRKTEEYIEPIEPIRKFDTESSVKENRTGCAEASEIVSRRIYVNGAWGRDLGHGYEIPLWNREDRTPRQDRPGLYPKPLIALRTHAGENELSRHWVTEPEHLFFYSNTEPNIGSNPDAWAAKVYVDCPKGAVRLPVFSADDDNTPSAILANSAMPPPRPGGARRPRFDLSVHADGPANVQHDRGETPMLAPLTQMSLARTTATGPIPPNGDPASSAIKTVKDLAIRASKAEHVATTFDQAIADVLATLPALIQQYPNCADLKNAAKDLVNKDIQNWKANINGIDTSFLDSDWASLTAPLSQELKRHAWYPASLIQAQTDNIGDFVQSIRREVTSNWDPTRLPDFKKALKTLWQDFKDKEIANAKDKLNSDFRSFIQTNVAIPLANVAAALTNIKNTIANVTDATVRAACDSICNAVVPAAVESLAAVRDPTFIRAKQYVNSALDRIRDTAILAKSRSADSDATQTIKRLSTLIDATSTSIQQWTAISVADTSANLDILTKTIDDLIAKLPDAPLPASAPTTIFDALNELDGQLSATSAAFVSGYKDWLNAIGAAIDTATQPFDDMLKSVASNIASEAASCKTDSAAWLNEFNNALAGAIDNLGNNCDQLESTVVSYLQPLGQKIRDQIVSSFSEVLDDVTCQHMDMLYEIKDVKDEAGKALKLVKAIGELPALPHLTFNADRIEYVFDDAKKEIETSPFAAKMKEIDTGLKELGLAIPTNKLLDQFIPNFDNNLDFSSVFRNLGGIDFGGLFSGFKLQGNRNWADQVKVTHGLDRETRSAWIKAEVNAPFPDEQTLFDFGVAAVKVANMTLNARSDVCVSADGQRQAITQGDFIGDWGLDFGGARLVAFREVTVHFDGGGFHFDISPDKVELHPSIRFVSDVAKTLGDQIPPAIKIEKDERGLPVGASVNLVTTIPEPISLGVVTIGSLSISGGLGLKAVKGFVIEASFSVGTRETPVFVQVSFLGGGVWLVNRVERQGDGTIVYSADIGVALGSTRAINVAGIASGSYSILLFAYATYSSAGGGACLTAGLSMRGGARILGMVNAWVSLLLEAKHDGNGNTTGHGVLDVEVPICWCYTLRVHREVKHSL